MKSLLASHAVMFGILFALFGAPLCLLAGGQFRRFPETVSPDGSYALGWGARENAHDDLASLKDVSADKEKGPAGGMDDDRENYLVDAVAGRPVAVIPDFHYFAGPEGRQNHDGISVAWSPGAKTALAIYDGRWSYEAISWIVPAERRCIGIGKQLEAAFRHMVLVKDKGEAGAVSFQSAALPNQDTLVVEAWGQVPKSESAPVYHYRLKFHVSAEGKKARVELVKSHSISDKEETSNGDTGTAETAEVELNRIYGKLRAKLNDAGRESLKTEEKTWLGQRGAMSDDDRLQFTRLRINELRVRAEDW
jgi:hypothetical protein